MSRKVVAIIQARMASRRFPGKVLALIRGKPMLWHVVHRAEQIVGVNRVVVATSVEGGDHVIAEFCRDALIPCFQGCEWDVLDRYWQVAMRTDAEVIVRITGDCPMLDPAISGEVLRVFLDGNYTYVSNTLPRTFPRGLDTEVILMGALDQAWRLHGHRHDREHVTSGIRREKFQIGDYSYCTDLSDRQWSVDQLDDLKFVRWVFLQLGFDFGMSHILQLLEAFPEKDRRE